MCTALNYLSDKHYFGRNLDWSHSYGEKVIIMPRNYSVQYKREEKCDSHYAIMGMGIVADNYPLYFDGVNEVGLYMAGLNFPQNAVYNEPEYGKTNIAPYELIIWVLTQCKTTDDVKVLLKNTNIINIPFNSIFPLAPMHWIVSDATSSLTIEPIKNGLMVYDNSFGVLANNPPFPEQIKNIGKNFVSQPGDKSSETRFAHAVHLRKTSALCEGEKSCVSQFFHIMSQLEMIKRTDDMQYTIYSSCINATDGIYYTRLYEDEKIYTTKMYEQNLSRNDLII